MLSLSLLSLILYCLKNVQKGSKPIKGKEETEVGRMYKSTNKTRIEGTFNLKQKHITRTETGFLALTQGKHQRKTK